MACTYLHVLEKINAATLLDVQFQSQLALWRYRPVRTHRDLGQPRTRRGNSATLFYSSPLLPPPLRFLSNSPTPGPIEKNDRARSLFSSPIKLSDPVSDRPLKSVCAKSDTRVAEAISWLPVYRHRVNAKWTEIVMDRIAESDLADGRLFHKSLSTDL